MIGAPVVVVIIDIFYRITAQRGIKILLVISGKILNIFPAQGTVQMLLQIVMIVPKLTINLIAERMV